MAGSIQLRNVHLNDIAAFYAHHLQLHPLCKTASEEEIAAENIRFAERWERMILDSAVLVQAILWQGSVAGYIAHFAQLGRPALSYWVSKDYWGQGIATQAVEAFLPLVQPRPLYARVAWDNHASLRVLEKVGFAIVGKGRFFSERHGAEVDEMILELR
jgi:RimJ/RimL family protein N-acetyltransferase